jgi:hypothetical protein
MADDVSERYKRAAAMRLMAAMMPGSAPSQPQPPAPNYNAIPLNPFNVPYTGLRNEPGLPPFQQPGQASAQAMPPMNLPPPPAAPAPRPGPSPAPQAAAPRPMPSMPPVQVQAPPMDPRTMGDADLGGYGGNMGQGAPIPAPQQYSHLNPTPSLEEVFRREYAANPAAFGKLFG